MKIFLQVPDAESIGMALQQKIYIYIYRNFVRNFQLSIPLNFVKHASYILVSWKFYDIFHGIYYILQPFEKSYIHTD